MMMENGESGVTVNKEELIKELTKNREAHRQIFLEAQKVYREDVIEELDRMLAEARSGKPIRRAVQLVEPQDHTRDYDRALKMLTMCIQPTVFITESEFAQYVQDDWGWKREFIGTTSNYLNKLNRG